MYNKNNTYHYIELIVQVHVKPALLFTFILLGFLFTSPFHPMCPSEATRARSAANNLHCFQSDALVMQCLWHVNAVKLRTSHNVIKLFHNHSLCCLDLRCGCCITKFYFDPLIHFILEKENH